MKLICRVPIGLGRITATECELHRTIRARSDRQTHATNPLRQTPSDKNPATIKPLETTPLDTPFFDKSLFTKPRYDSTPAKTKLDYTIKLLPRRRNNHGDRGRQVPLNFLAGGDQQRIGPPNFWSSLSV